MRTTKNILRSIFFPHIVPAVRPYTCSWRPNSPPHSNHHPTDTRASSGPRCLLELLPRLLSSSSQKLFPKKTCMSCRKSPTERRIKRAFYFRFFFSRGHTAPSPPRVFIFSFLSTNTPRHIPRGPLSHNPPRLTWGFVLNFPSGIISHTTHPAPPKR